MKVISLLFFDLGLQRELSASYNDALFFCIAVTIDRPLCEDKREWEPPVPFSSMFWQEHWSRSLQNIKTKQSLSSVSGIFEVYCIRCVKCAWICYDFMKSFSWEKMTAIKHALQRDIFTPNDERLLSIVNVCKAGKKKRNCFLCATGM